MIDYYPINVFSHFPYVANLAGSIKQLAWVGDLEQDEKTIFIIKDFRVDLILKINILFIDILRGFWSKILYLIIHLIFFKN